MPSDAKPSKHATHFRWFIFSAACGTSWLLYVHRYMFGLIKPLIAEEWHLGNEQLGFLDSVFSACYTAFQLPLGIATDAIGVHVVLTVLIAVWSIGLGLHAWLPAQHLWLARATLGTGQSAVFAGQSRITKTWFPLATRTTVQGWIGVFCGRFGGLSAALLVGSFMLGVCSMPWRTVVYVMAGLGLAHAVLFATLFRNSPRNHPMVNEAERELIEDTPRHQDPPPRPSVLRLLRHTNARAAANLLALNFQSILSTLADNVFSAWIPLFLWQEHQLKYQEMGVYASLPLLGGAMGGAVGGVLNDWLIARTGSRRWSRTLVAASGKGTAGILLLLALLYYDNPQVFCISLLFVKFFSDWSLTTTWGTVTDIGGRTSASVFAYNNTVAGIGSIAGPAIYGIVSARLGWMHVFLTAAATYLACAATWFVINCNVPIVATNSSESDL